MNKDIAIKVENLSKVYKLYNAPIDRMKEALHPFKKSYHKEFYALNDISFEIKKGQTVGIIGKNGSGKSTLLKIITGVLNPTSGNVTVNGRISALLELGAGFNPEYTGMENIYFQGNLMGFEREEMESKVQRILDFADIGDFIHQPVKNYSSGMFARLAFAVAINVEPEILIVDEALSVGDARFQLKCFTKIEQIKSTGCCVLFVSHSLEQIKRYCERAILLDGGVLLGDGDSKEICNQYNKLLFPQSGNHDLTSKIDIGNEAITEVCSTIRDDGYVYQLENKKISEAEIFGFGGASINSVNIYGLQPPNLFSGNDKIKIEVDFSWKQHILQELQIEYNLSNDIVVGISFADESGYFIFAGNSFDAGVSIDFLNTNKGKCIFNIDMPYLKISKYFITVAITLGDLGKFINLSRYDFLIEIECIGDKRKRVFGLIGINYSVEIVD